MSSSLSSAPIMSIAVSASWCHFERSCACIHAVLRPRLWGRRSSTIVRSHQPCPPWSTCPVSPFRWRTTDSCSNDARVVLWWIGYSIMSQHTKSSLCDNWGDWRLTCSIRLTSSLVICAVYGIYTIRRRHHWSNASRRRLALVILHVSAPHRRIGSMYTHCKVEPWSANWRRITSGYDLVISFMSGPFCTHPLRVHLYRIQGSNLDILAEYTDTLKG